MKLCLLLAAALGLTTRIEANGDSKGNVLIIHDKESPTLLIDWLNMASPELVLSKTTSLDEISQTDLIDPTNDELLYKNLVLLGGKLPKKVENKDFVEFARRGGNILWALPSPPTGQAGGGTTAVAALESRTRTLAFEFGRVLDVQPAKVFDYANSGANNNPMEVPVRLVPETASKVFSTSHSGERLSAFSHRLDNDNPLVFPLITAQKEAIADCGKVSLDRCIPPYGTDNILASALQTRVNSRVTIISGDSLFRKGPLSLMAQDILAWTFQQTGQLRMETFQHYNLENRQDGKGYRIGDHLELRVCLSTKRKVHGGYEPVQPKDLQMELVMLNAWLRADLSPTTGSDGCLSTGSVTLPDRYGVYTLKLRYQRRGWPHIIHEETLVLRPIHHDEFIRHLIGSLPYYIGWLSMMITSAFLIFPLVFPLGKTL